MTKPLNTIARDKLASLLAETGHVLTLEDYPSVMAVDTLAQKVMDPLRDEAGDVAPLPVTCGNVTLSAPSIGRLIWWNSKGARWLSSDPFALDVGLGYLCSTDISDAELRLMSGPREFRRRVMRWASRLSADPETFARAVLALLPSVDDDDSEGGRKEDAKSEMGGMIGLLVREYGNTPEYWIWDAPWPVVRALLADWRHHCAENEKASASASRKGGAKKGGSAKPVAPSAGAATHALKRLRLYVNALRSRWKESANG